MARIKRRKAETTPTPKPPRSSRSTSFIERQMARIAKADKALSALAKDLARVPDQRKPGAAPNMQCWGAEARAALDKASVGLTSATFYVNLAPENFEPPRKARGVALEAGDTVAIAERYQPAYKLALRGVAFGVTATGIVTAIEGGRALVEFGDDTFRMPVELGTRQLVKCTVIADNAKEAG